MITQKGINTKKEIVKQACKLFQSKPINKVSVSSITKQASMGKSTFYAYFKSKDDLIWYIIESEIKALYMLFDDFMSRGYQSQDLDYVVDSIITYVFTNKEKLQLVNDFKFYTYIGKSRIQKTYYDDHGIIGPIYAWLEKGKSLGHLDIIDITFTSIFMTHVIDEMISEIILEEVPYSLERLTENLKHVVKKLLEV